MKKHICGDCPDQDLCQMGASCDYVRGSDAIFQQYNALLTGKAQPVMSNTTKATPASVAAQAAEEKLVTSVPNQGEATVTTSDTSDQKTTGEKAKEVVEETAETTKKTLKEKAAALVAKVKENKKFIAGFAAGAVSTAVVMAQLAKEKLEEVVEVTVVEETVTPEDSSDQTV